MVWRNRIPKLHIAYSLAELDPDRAMAWVDSIPGTSARNRAIEQLLNSMSDEHPDQALQLANEQSELSVSAITHVAESMAGRNSAEAFNWIDSQTSEVERDAVARVLQGLVRSNPSVAAVN